MVGKAVFFKRIPAPENSHLYRLGRRGGALREHAPAGTALRASLLRDRGRGSKAGFGNQADNDLLRIWNSRAYREFRRVLNERRLIASKELPQREEFPDPPRPCRTCHKMLGL